MTKALLHCSFAHGDLLFVNLFNEEIKGFWLEAYDTEMNSP